jgi:hypothetical protein
VLSVLVFGTRGQAIKQPVRGFSKTMKLSHLFDFTNHFFGLKVYPFSYVGRGLVKLPVSNLIVTIFSEILERWEDEASPTMLP